MLEKFDPDHQFAPKISEISFSDKDGGFSLEITAINQEIACWLKNKFVS